MTDRSGPDGDGTTSGSAGNDRAAPSRPGCELADASERPPTSFGARESQLIETATMQARILIRLGELARAEAVLKGTRSDGDDPRVDARLNEALSELRLAQGRAAEAVSLAEKACLTAESGDGRERVGLFAAPWEAHCALARALHAVRRDAEAETALREAIASVGSLTRAGRSRRGGAGRGIFEARLAPYGRARDAPRRRKPRARGARRRGSVESARSSGCSREGKGRSLSEMTAPEREKEEKLEERVRALNRRVLADRRAVDPALSRELDSVRVALETFRSELFLKYPALRARRVPDVDVLASLPERIPAGTAALEYVVQDQCTYVFTARRGACGWKFGLSKSRSRGQRSRDGAKPWRTRFPAAIPVSRTRLAIFMTFCSPPWSR